MKIILAERAGFCFGVKRAVEESIETQKKFNKKIYTLGPLIHNNDVVNYLKDKGIFPIELDEVDKLNFDDVVIIRSHGVTEDVLNLLNQKGLIVINATCPYVLNIQKKAKKYYELGYKIVIVGDRNHPEVVGINGWCKNEAIVTKEGEGLDNLSGKVCLLSQTTEKQENFKKVFNILENNKSLDLVTFNTICSATQQRQEAADKLSKNVDVMFVIGGKSSSNTTKLFEICRKNCNKSFHIENAKELPEYIIKDVNIKKIGITAGASTPDWIIKEAINKMEFNKDVNLNEQEQLMKEFDKKLSIGEVVEGEIISLNEREAYVNIGYKSDALLPIDEVSKEEGAILTDLLKIGEKVKAKIIKLGNEPVLSIIEIKRDLFLKQREEAYKQLLDAANDKKDITIMVTKVVNGGLEADFNGANVFVPASHIELSHVEDLSKYVGLNLKVNIIEFSREKRKTKVIASRREILKKEKMIREENALNSIQKGCVVEGEVKRITNFGAFVDINGIDGLLHISEMSYGKVDNISDIVKIGDKIKVYILDVDMENKKISLSLKKAQPNPWDNIEEKYPLNNIVLSKIVRFTNFGAFAELEPGIDALIHISQISNKRITKPQEELKIGEYVKAKIINVDKENKRIELSIKQVEEF